MTSVTIVGAGPAGLVAAETLAKRGVSVHVVDQDENPGEWKPCAGMLRDAALRMFKVRPELACRQIRGIRVVLPNHQVDEVSYAHPIFWNFDRGTLARHLVERVRKAGGSVDTGIRVVDVTRADEGARVSGYKLKLRASDGGIERVKAGMLIAADGVNSIIVKKTVVHPPFRPSQLGQCVQYQILMDNQMIEKRIGDMNEFYYGGDVSPFGYAWIVPKDNSVTVGVGALLSKVNTSLKKFLDYVMTRHPVASGKLAGGKILRFEAALCPLSGLVSPTYGDGLVVVGDAAGHCSSISGEGMHYSMVAGEIAGRICSEAVEMGDISARFLGKYEGAWRRAIGSDMKWGRWLQNIALKRGFMSGAFAKDTRLRSRLSRKVADILSGRRTYRESLIRAIPDFLIMKMAGAISTAKEDN
ncbi:MAG: NAD(P)/FAD-dependent oxidoreductase [Promethearchaeati archaeon SRVP18_Atabeyarchaeia-1]